MADADFNVKAIISAQTSQFEKGMKNAQSSVNSLSSSISNITNLVKKAFAFTGVAIGTKAMVDFGKSCVQSANQAIKTFNILDNTVKATGADAWTSIGELENASKSLSDQTNYSVTEIQRMQSVLLGFINITGEAFDGASEAVLDMATVMGMDLTSAVQTIGKALDDPVSGLDSLRRQGFKFTDEQKAELGQLVKNGKQYEAQKIILDTLATSYGGAAKAGQDSFAKQRHAVENLSDTFGAKLIPVMQVFAENNAKMINSLTDVISKMDFTPVVNVVTNLSKIFNTAFENISAYLKKGADEVSDFITRFNFKPIISILDILIGVLAGIISKFKEINSQNLEIFDKLKESLIDFSNSEIFQNIVNFINKIIDAVFFLWSEIQDISDEIRKLIVNKIIEIWNKIKEVFQNSQNALANSGQDIASWGDYFYSILDNAFKIFQDFVNMIKAVLHGDWAVAWEYAKLSVMRVCDNILTVFSTVMNAFPKLVNKIIDGVNAIIKTINKVREFIGQDPLGLVEAFDSVDLSKSTGLEDKIKEAENKIQELTGQVADKSIKDLESVSTKFAGFTFSALTSIQNLTQGIEKETEKQKQYFSSVVDDSENNYKKFSEWDLKLLQQRLDDLSEWSDEYHQIQLDMIEAERQKATESAKTQEEILKINQYYDKEIEKENERSEEAKRANAKETMKQTVSTLGSIAKASVNVFKKVVGTIKDVFSKIVNFVKDVFSKLKNIFSTLFDFNVDDALDNLLKVEDAILTFFVETLPKLPSFFESAFSSVLVLIQTLINSIDWDSVKDILTSMVNTFVNYAPQIVKGIIDIFTNLVTTISTVLVDNAPEIVDAFGQMFFAIIEALPSIITNLISVLGTYISEIGKYFTDNSEKLSEDLTALVKSVVDGVVNFIQSGGWKNVLDAILAIQKAVENAVVENIDELVDGIVDMLPDLIETLKESIVSASQTLGKLAPEILPLIADIISAIIEIITSDDVLDSFFEAVEGIVDGLIQAIMKLIPKALPKLINFSIKLINPRSFIKLTGAIVKGLINGFAKTDWWQVIKDIFEGFIDAFKDLFGIHSPSTLFESFGGFMIEGLVNGLKGIAEAINTILQPIIDLISDVVTKLIDGFVALNEVSFKGLTDSITAVSDGVTKLSEVSFEGISDNIKTVNDGLTGITQITFDGLNKGITAVADGVSKITDSVTALVKELGNLIEKAGKAVDALNPLSGGSSSGSTKSTGDKIADVLTGGLWSGVKGIFGFATGSQSVPKGLALVGESGPELVKFRGGEQVLNSHNTQKALQSAGNKTINQNITFNNLQDTSAYAMIQQLKQYNRQMAINGII